MAALYRKAMDALYLICVWIAGTALVLISAVIPWAVFTRYVLNSAASWPERTAVLLTIVLTFFGTAACYRLGLHMNVSFFAAMLPPRSAPLGRSSRRTAGGVMALFMVIYGVKLGPSHLAEHRSTNSRNCRSASTYSPIPLGGARAAAVRHRAPHHRRAGRGICRASAAAGHPNQL